MIARDEFRTIAGNGIWKQNTSIAQILGLCPLLAVTTNAVNGIMLRDKPAANIYLGSFYAESLLLAETGFSTGAIQIAGTAQVAQLPFFVVACDYTLIGEEHYAAGAYLSREPRLLGSLKGCDFMKVALILAIVVGCGLETAGVTSFKQFFESQ